MSQFVKHSVKLMRLNYKNLIAFRKFVLSVYKNSTKKSLETLNLEKRQENIVKNLENGLQKFNANVEIVFETTQKIIANQNYFFLANHNNALDPLFSLWAMTKLQKNVLHIANREIAKTPFLSNLAKSVDTLLIDRENKRQAVIDSREILKKAKTNSLFIYPQGDVGREKPIRKGALQIAKKSKLPIVFVELQNTSEILKDNYLNIKNKTIKIVVRKIVTTQEISSLTIEEISTMFYNSVNLKGPKIL